MELITKRSEKRGAFSTSYDLFAKLELEHKEQAIVRKRYAM